MTGAEKKQSIDAVALLKTALLNADHRNVDTLFEDLELASKSELKVRIVQQICSTLTSHALAEEKPFYPALYEALKKKSGTRPAMARIARASLWALMAKIDECSPQNELVDAHLTVLGEYVRHRGEGESADPNALKRDIAAFKALVARSLAASAARAFKDLNVHRRAA